MTDITWKERQTNGSLFEKTLSLKIKKICSAKKGVQADTTIIRHKKYLYGEKYKPFESCELPTFRNLSRKGKLKQINLWK